MSCPAVACDRLSRSFRIPRGVRAFLPPFRVETPFRVDAPFRVDTVEALRDVTLEVEEGEVLGIVGPNGGGKTTLLEILATYLLPTAGRAWVLGREVRRQPLAVRRLVGYCQSGGKGFDPRLTGQHNLEFWGVLGGLGLRAARDQAERARRMVGLDAYRDVAVARYSDGMRQRLNLARALLLDPPVLLLDEPTRGLDPEAAGSWRSRLRALAEAMGKTVLLVTHDLREVEEICDRAAVLEQGSLSRAPNKMTAWLRPAAEA